MPEPANIVLTVNGKAITVASGTTVAAAIVMSGGASRTSVTGEPRSPLCGMGICFECRATVNGTAHRKTCLALCEQGMDVRTT